METSGVPLSPGVDSPAAPLQRPLATTTHASPFFHNSTASRSCALNAATLRRCNLLLRGLALLLSLAAALALLEPSSLEGSNFQRAACDESPSSGAYRRSSGFFWYWVVVTTATSLYSILQLFKGTWDLAFKGTIISDELSDYITFFLDQVMAYLLLSTASISTLVIENIKSGPSKRVMVAACCLSFASFSVMVLCTLLSSYKLGKRIIW